MNQNNVSGTFVNAPSINKNQNVNNSNIKKTDNNTSINDVSEGCRESQTKQNNNTFTRLNTSFLPVINMRSVNANNVHNYRIEKYKESQTTQNNNTFTRLNTNFLPVMNMRSVNANNVHNYRTAKHMQDQNKYT